MNKDVIYIEPEDDITDIITKIEKSKEKIVALVPPKKAGILRSIVNIKLITKASQAANKKVVLVTTDPSIKKLAASARLPITKDLQSAPSIPGDEDAAETATEEENTNKAVKSNKKEMAVNDVEVETEEDLEKGGVDENELDDDDADEDGDDAEDKSKKSKKEKLDNNKKSTKPKQLSGNQVIDWCKGHKKLLIGCGIGLILLILILIWALVIAPAVTITLDIRTTTSNFSENITFTETLTDENVSEGRFYLEQRKIESQAEVEFTATGTKNIGEKAKGSVVVIAQFIVPGSAVVDAGATFSLGDLTYIADQAVKIAWDGKPSDCENSSEPVGGGGFRCRLSARVKVTAAQPGTQYNIAASSTGWKTSSANVASYSDAAMAGGTDQNITIVQQSDIDEAVKKIETTSEEASKESLYDTIDEGAFIVDNSFRQTVSDVVSRPAVGEEVKAGEVATASMTTTSTVYVMDKTKIEEFIAEKAKLAENYKIYSMNDPFIENFMKTDGAYVGKLKTSYVSGPKITENDVVETTRGKGLGSAQHDLKDSFSGISSITIDPSFPWVNAVPNDVNKITVVINVEE